MGRQADHQSGLESLASLRFACLTPDACWTPARRLSDGLKPGIHCARTHWIRGFIAFRLAQRTGTVMLMVPA